MIKIRDDYNGVKQNAEFGKWIVQGAVFRLPESSESSNHRWYVVAKCRCGRVDVVECRSLARGLSVRCQSCRAREIQIEHGLSGTPLHGVWKGIKRRCFQPKFKQWQDYGGRGITMCREWSESFVAFHDWAMSSGYRPGLEIDRFPNNDGHYEPTNCRWVTKFENGRNKRNNVMLTLNGVTKCVSEWAGINGLSALAIYKRVYRGWDDEKTLTTPLKQY